MLFCFVFFRAIIEQKKRKSSSLSLFMKDGEKRKEKVFLSLSLFKRDGEKSKEMKRKLKKVEGSMKKRKKKRRKSRASIFFSSGSLEWQAGRE